MRAASRTTDAAQLVDMAGANADNGYLAYLDAVKGAIKGAIGKGRLRGLVPRHGQQPRCGMPDSRGLLAKMAEGDRPSE